MFTNDFGDGLNHHSYDLNISLDEDIKFNGATWCPYRHENSFKLISARSKEPIPINNSN